MAYCKNTYLPNNNNLLFIVNKMRADEMEMNTGTIPVVAYVPNYHFLTFNSMLCKSLRISVFNLQAWRNLETEVNQDYMQQKNT